MDVLELLITVRDFLYGINSLVVLSFVFLIGMYVFWRGCVESRKNRSSVFDMFLVSGFLSAVAGRIAYIILEWESFSSYIWYWLPYEKYGDSVFFFRLLPWRFLGIWDGGLVIFSMFVSILIFMTIYAVVIKRWRWKHLFFPVYFSATTMLGLSFAITGVLGQFTDWVYKGVILLFLMGIFFVLYKFIYSVVRDPLKEKYLFGYLGTAIVWLSSIYICYIYLIDDLSLFEDISVVVFAAWSIISGIAFLLDLKKANVTIETVSTIRSVQV
jgi:hypothetical protein